MSFVWNVVLSFGDEEFWEDGEDEARETSACLDTINAAIPHGELVDLTSATFAPGAGAGMTAPLYSGGFKHFDIEAFLALVAAQPWKDPQNVQVFLQSDADDCFVVRQLSRPLDAEEEEIGGAAGPGRSGMKARCGRQNETQLPDTAREHDVIEDAV